MLKLESHDVLTLIRAISSVLNPRTLLSQVLRFDLEYQETYSLEGCNFNFSGYEKFGSHFIINIFL